MPGYDYETISKDPMRRAEFLGFLQQFEAVLNLDPKKDEAGIELEKENDKPQLLEVIDGLRTTLNGGTVEQTIAINDTDETVAYTCDFNRLVDYMRCRMVSLDATNGKAFEKIKSLPGGDAFLEGIGMPERGTAGYFFDLYANGQMFDGGYKGYNARSTNGMTESQLYAGAFALMEMTGGGENWRDAKIDEQELAVVQHDYLAQLDGASGDMSDLLRASDKDSVDIAISLFGVEPKAITDKIDKEYFSWIASHNLEKAREDFKDNLRRLNGSPEEAEKEEKKIIREESVNELTDNRIPTVIQSTLAAGKPRRFNSYVDVMKEERKYRHLYEKFVKEQPREAVELLAKKPEKLLDAIAPPAKSRIEELQGRIKKEKDPEKKMRLAAEIIANRQLADVHRGGDGLENRPDPVQVEQRARDLAAEMAGMRRRDPKAMDKLIAQATSGHGGKMMEEYEKIPITHLDYINRLDLENPGKTDVARLAAATMLFVQEKDGAQAIADREQIDHLAVSIARSPAFDKLMQDPNTFQNAKVGFGLRITEQLRKVTEELEAAKKAEEAKKKAEEAKKKAEAAKKEAEREKAQEQIDLKQIEKDRKDPEHRKAVDRDFFKKLSEYGKTTPFTEERRSKVQNYLNTHPSCRAEAQEIIRENKLKGLTVPKIREVPDEQLVHPEKNKAALQQQQEAEKQKEAAKRGPKKEAGDGPKLGG